MPLVSTKAQLHAFGNHVADATAGLELGVGDVVLGRRDQLGR